MELTKSAVVQTSFYFLPVASNKVRKYDPNDFFSVRTICQNAYWKIAMWYRKGASGAGCWVTCLLNAKELD